MGDEGIEISVDHSRADPTIPVSFCGVRNPAHTPSEAPYGVVHSTAATTRLEAEIVVRTSIS
jgi:hypothetical protein